MRGAPPAVVYPDSPKGDDLDQFHGTGVPDPYRWLEDPSSPDVAAWTADQNVLTSTVLRAMGPVDQLHARLTEARAHARSSIPVHVGDRTFTVQADGLQEQPVLHVTDEAAPPVTKVLLDPNAIAPDGSVALTGWTVDPDARFLAYELSRGGSDGQEIRVRDIRSGSDLPDVIRWVKSEEDLPFANVAWSPDASGFFYNRLPTPGTVDLTDLYRHSQVFWHRLGSPQDADELIFECPEDPDLNLVPIVTADGAFIALHGWRGLSGRHEVYVRRLDEGGAFIHLLSSADARYLYLGNDDERFFFHTTAAAPRGRVIAVDLKRPQASDWTEILSERDDPIERVHLLGRDLIVVTIRDAHHRASIVGLDGKPETVLELPDRGTVTDVALDVRSAHLLVQFQSFLRPMGILRFDMETGELLDDGAPSISYDPSTYVTARSFAPAADGTRIPVTVIHRADMVRDGRHPLLLYGYGGFNVSTTPLFDPLVLDWLEWGGVYAMANPRGGGEYGEAWHEAGMRHAKQTVFDDLQAVASWLVDNGFTTSARLAIRGESNGGLLVAACMLQRPDLFGAVVCSAPVTDMLRFPRYTIGYYWTPEYGDATADPDDFRTLYRYSPLEHVQAGVDYPPILVTTGDADDRVVPLHAMKFVAGLQNAAVDGSAPRLLRVQHGVGHGLGKPRSKIIELDADILAFLLGTVGYEMPSRRGPVELR